MNCPSHVNGTNISELVVLFDLEDTLVETPWADRQHVLEFRRETRSRLVELGIPEDLLAPIERSTLMRNVAEEYANAHFSLSARTRYHEDLAKFLSGYEMDSAEKSVLFPDAIPTLKELRRNRTRIGLVTNTSRIAVNRILEKNDFSKLLDCVVTRDDVSKLKPDPEGIILAAQILRTKSFYMVGDLMLDVLAAKKAGGKALLLRRGGHGHPSESAPIEYNEAPQKADYVISSLREIPKIIQIRGDE